MVRVVVLGFSWLNSDTVCMDCTGATRVIDTFSGVFGQRQLLRDSLSVFLCSRLILRVLSPCSGVSLSSCSCDCVSSFLLKSNLSNKLSYDLYKSSGATVLHSNGL